jgi:hypothetical protein
MRILWGILGLLFLGGVTAAQAPASKPTGSLAQVMRGIYFPNANILFDVQSDLPRSGKRRLRSGAVRFFGIYTGWQVVENSAIALEEAACPASRHDCASSRPVPVQRAGWAKYTQQMSRGQEDDDAARPGIATRGSPRHRWGVRELPQRLSRQGRRVASLYSVTAGSPKGGHDEPSVAQGP